MPTYVAMLRGINLGPRKRIRMGDLAGLFTDLGHTGVSTYVQSGNVVFASPSRNEAELVGRIEQRIAEELPFPVTVLVRSRTQLAGVVQRCPFLDRPGAPTSLHTTFLAAPPPPGPAGEIDAARYAPDELAIAGREVHLHCPNGYGRTKLNNAFWESRLGVAATTRNWNTITHLLALASD